MTLTSLFLSVCLGETLAYAGNLLLNSRIFAIYLTITLIVMANILFYVFFPETPLTLVKRKKFAEAEESIRFYKNIRKTDEHQLETLKQELDRVKYVAADGDLDANQMRPLQWADFNANRAGKALMFGFVLIVLNVSSNNPYITVKHSQVLTKFPMNLSEVVSKLIISTAVVLGTIVAIQLVDRIGRKVKSSSSEVCMF